MTTAPPVTLAAWLLERIAEDERCARSVRKMNNGIDGGAIMPPIVHEGRRKCIDYGRDMLDRRPLTDDEYAAMIEQCSTPAEPDPRVLADIEAKRRIVAMVQGTPPYDGEEYRMYCGDAVLRALALPYADAPGYRDEWRP